MGEERGAKVSRLALQDFDARTKISSFMFLQNGLLEKRLKSTNLYDLTTFTRHSQHVSRLEIAGKQKSQEHLATALVF